MNPSAPRIIQADGVPPQAWRNGGGQTRELLVWPSPADGRGDWQLRISRADITRDGPFSAFPGVDRWFAVLEGAGVVLHFSEEERTLRAGDPPRQFDGAAAPGCSLLQGPTQDLNLMVHGGMGCMELVVAQALWNSKHTMQGLYTCGGGQWGDGLQTLTLPAHALLWTAQHEDRAWAFHPAEMREQLPSFWMGFTPQPVSAASGATP